MDLSTLPTYVEGFHLQEFKKMKYRQFGNTGLLTSVLGFGGSQLSLVYSTDKEQEGIEAVINAVKRGINYIDTAPYYGQGKSDIVLGKALKCIPRKAYYLATKVGRYGADFASMFDFSAERTFKSVEESLSKLGVDYVDVIQEKRLAIINAASLGMGLLTNCGPDWHPAGQEIKDACTKAARYCE